MRTVLGVVGNAVIFTAAMLFGYTLAFTDLDPPTLPACASMVLWTYCSAWFLGRYRATQRERGKG